MALATLTQCETRWRAVLASVDEGCENLIADRPVGKKEMDLLRASIVQLGQLVQNSPKVNGIAAKWKQLVDRVMADRRTL